MKLGLHQTTRPDLQLRLSPQLLQRIEVLQMNWLDLANAVEQELQENETLEAEVGAEEPAEEVAEPDPEELLAFDAEEQEVVRPRADEDAWDPIQREPARGRTLQDHLREQVEFLDLAERERAITLVLTQAVGDRGWLDVPLDQLEYDLEPPPTPTEIDHALHLLQGLEPRGVGATDMTECLLLQLDEDDPDYELLVTLVMHHLDDIARNRIPRIVRETGTDVDILLAAVERLRHLDPVPGRRFVTDDAPKVRPDVIVDPHEDGHEIRLESDWLPRLRISRAWLDMSRNREVDPALRKHIRGKIESARSLIDAIEQRKNTLFRVASELVNRQPEFLDRGPGALKPLRMQEIADALGIHVSTVSRAIAGKYMQTPRGIMPLKAFFSGEATARRPSSPSAAPSGQDGKGSSGEPSRAEVCSVLAELIEVEDKRHPLSDEALVCTLNERLGIELARRTVTKYRKAMDIGSSRSRRVYGSEA